MRGNVPRRRACDERASNGPRQPVGRPVSGGGKTWEGKVESDDRDPRACRPGPARPTSPSPCLPAGPGPGPGPQRRNGTPESRVRRHRPNASTHTGRGPPPRPHARAVDGHVSRSGLGRKFPRRRVRRPGRGRDRGRARGPLAGPPRAAQGRWAPSGAGRGGEKTKCERHGRADARQARPRAGRAAGARARRPALSRSSAASTFGSPRAEGHRRAPVDTTGQPGGRAAVTPSETCTSNLRRTGDAPSPRLHRDDSAGDAGRPQRLPGHSGQIPPLGAVAGAPEGRDDIKAAARWRPTTGANVSGTDPDREPARAPRRRPGRRTSSRPTSDGLYGPGAGRLRPPSSRPPRRDPRPRKGDSGRAGEGEFGVWFRFLRFARDLYRKTRQLTCHAVFVSDTRRSRSTGTHLLEYRILHCITRPPVDRAPTSLAQTFGGGRGGRFLCI